MINFFLGIILLIGAIVCGFVFLLAGISCAWSSNAAEEWGTTFWVAFILGGVLAISGFFFVSIGWPSVVH